jgi:hypothetical protein
MPATVGSSLGRSINAVSLFEGHADLVLGQYVRLVWAAVC